jgi:hypothetical protein
MGSYGDLVLLDKGAADGLQVGQVMEVSPNFSMSKDFRIVQEAFAQPVGKVKIISVTDAGSVGYLASSRQEILIGDYVGKKL